MNPPAIAAQLLVVCALASHWDAARAGDANDFVAHVAPQECAAPLVQYRNLLGERDAGLTRTQALQKLKDRPMGAISAADAVATAFNFPLLNHASLERYFLWSCKAKVLNVGFAPLAAIANDLQQCQGREGDGDCIVAARNKALGQTPSFAASVPVAVPRSAEVRAASANRAPAPVVIRLEDSHCVLPYPAIAKADEQTGVATVAVKVDAKGRMSSPRLVRSSGFTALNEATIAGIASCMLSPVPAVGPDAWVSVSYTWTLE
jgi:TonB family protein